MVIKHKFIIITSYTNFKLNLQSFLRFRKKMEQALVSLACSVMQLSRVATYNNSYYASIGKLNPLMELKLIT